MLCKNSYVLLVFLLFFNFSFAQKKEVITTDSPTIGLVLSGGGSRGYAHIGVLKVLEELGIQPDYITGTSQGALIGAMYSLGYSVDEIEKNIRNVNWESIFSDRKNYRDIPVLLKKAYPKYPLKIFLDKGYIPKIPTGIIEGHELQALFSELAWKSNYYKNFDAFPIPFRCVASDLVSGKAFVFKEGNLATAMRASMSVPALFTPVDKDSMLLVDGGVFRNFPVKECKDMGAEIIIGVYAVGNNDKPKKEEINSMGKIISVGVKTFLNDLEKEDIALTDIYIVPELNEFRGIEMKKYIIITKRGEDAARKPEVYNKLIEISKVVKTAKIQENNKNFDSIFIDKILVNGCNHSKPENILKISGLKEYSSITAFEMKKAVDKIYTTNNFKKVTYQIQNNGEESILELHVFEKNRLSIRVGTHYSFAYGLEGLLQTTYKDFILNNSELKFKTSLARSPRALLNYNYLPFGSEKMAFSLNLYSQYTKVPNSNLIIHATDKNNYFSEVLVDANFNIAWSPIKNIALQTGIGNNYINLSLKEELKNLYQTNTIEINHTYFDVGFIVNTLNAINFPTKGMKIKANYTNQFKIKSSQKETIESNHIYTFNYKHYLPFSKSISVISEFCLGSMDKTSFITQKFYFGGLNNEQRPNRVNFGGLTTQEMTANHFMLAGLGLQFKLKDILFLTIEGQSLNLNINSMQQVQSDFLDQKTIWNIQATASYKTPLGPVSLSIAKNPQQKGMIPAVNIGVGF